MLDAKDAHLRPCGFASRDKGDFQAHGNELFSPQCKHGRHNKEQNFAITPRNLPEGPNCNVPAIPGDRITHRCLSIDFGNRHVQPQVNNSPDVIKWLLHIGQKHDPHESSVSTLHWQHNQSPPTCRFAPHLAAHHLNRP